MGSLAFRDLATFVCKFDLKLALFVPLKGNTGRITADERNQLVPEPDTIPKPSF